MSALLNISDDSPVDVNAEALTYLRKETIDLYNRLHSIDEDVTFVNQVRAFYHSQAFLPNLRCGAWYTDPKRSVSQPAYFKSTDGHYSNWSFNLRRPNLHLISVALAHNGLVLVDSTRAGKRIPDALSKTVPIWCAVVNRAVLRRTGAVKSPAHWDCRLYTPPAVVSAQEHRQIEAQLDVWATLLADSSYGLPDLPHPLRPLWITPDTTKFPSLPSEGSLNFIPIICVSASKQVRYGVERRLHGFAYVQGSGDDHELWGMGLSPELFWDNRDALLSAERADLENLVAELVSKRPRNGIRETLPTPVKKVFGRLLLCSLAELPLPSPDNDLGNAVFVILDPLPVADAVSTDPADPSTHVRVLRLHLAPGKKGQHELLHGVLPQVVQFAAVHLTDGRDVCVACESGKDASVGVALALLSQFFDHDGAYSIGRQQTALNKKSIRTRLQWIISSRPQANPSRATLKRVNEFLLSSRPLTSIRPPN